MQNIRKVISKQPDLLILMVLYFPFFLLHWNGMLDPRTFDIHIFHQIFSEKTGFFAALTSGTIIWVVLTAIYVVGKIMIFKLLKCVYE